jgi:hypothetical protein
MMMAVFSGPYDPSSRETPYGPPPHHVAVTNCTKKRILVDF